MTQLRTSGLNSHIADTLVPPDDELRQAVNKLGAIDPDFLKIENEVGALNVRRWSATFASLVRIIYGQ
ncbi:MAG: hypothetical protein QNJ51_13380 [Calothrix sp. MO_167.B12]|nr:hypothetical protein [Calothrix sp. MO_167.B12]